MRDPRTSALPFRARRRELLALGIVLAAAGLVYGSGLGWGLHLPTRTGWAVDAIRPDDLTRAWEMRFSGGWSFRYAPFQFYLLSPLYAAILLATGLDPASPEAGRLHFLAGGMLSMAMALGTVVAVWAAGRELRDDGRTGPWAAALAAFSAPAAYYATTVNVDVPYVFWFSLFLWLWLRWARTRAARDATAAAVCATLAATTKDQAFALYVLPAAWSAWRVLRAGMERSASSRASARLARALRSRELWLPLGAAALLGVLILNPIGNPTGLRAHAAQLLGDASRPWRMFPADPAGLAALAGFSLEQVAHSLGWPALLLGVAGMAVGIARPGRDPRWRLLALPVPSYILFFILPILYAYDRFWLPLHLVLALFAAGLLARAAERGPGARGAAAVAGGVAVAFALAAAVSVELRRACDGRYAVEAWMRANVPSGATVVGIGLPEYLPALAAWPRARVAAPDAGLLEERPEFVITSGAYGPDRYPPGDPRRDLFAGLASGRLGYVELLDVTGRPRWSAIDPEGLRRMASGVRTDALLTRSGTNLDKVAPRIRIFRRAAGGGEAVGVVTGADLAPRHPVCRLR